MQRLLLLCVLFAGCQKPSERVVVYCAQDREFAEGIFNDYQHKTGLTISPKFDTEANKSVGLASELETEKDRPRCDVHWNNEILGTIRLARKGVYEPYESSSAKVFPAWTMAKDKTWQAFAARARVLIVNTNLVPEAERPKSLMELTQSNWKGKFAMAKPLFGTTATHAACLFEVLGSDAAKSFFNDLKANHVQIVAGNKQVARDVAAGKAAIGLTDTDDALIELHDRKPVAIIFPDADVRKDHQRMGTLYIPNTLAVVKGAPNAAGARKLVDHLLSAEIETKLAEGGGFQIPLNPAVKAILPEALKTPNQVKAMEVDFEKAADLWEESQAFLKDLFAR